MELNAEHEPGPHPVPRLAPVPLVEVDRIAFHFSTRSVFHELSLAFAPGLTWLHGANGRGKTTLLKLLGGALAPGGGAVRLAGIDSRGAPLAYRRQCFYCGGDAPALDWLSVREWLDLHLSLYSGADGAALRIGLDAFGIAAIGAQPVSNLSLGQYKKLQLSLALALPVRLLLLDEPFNGLDMPAVTLLETLLAQRATRHVAAQDGAIVLTSHLAPRLTPTATLDLDAVPGVL